MTTEVLKRLTEDNGILSGKLVGEVTRAKDAEPCSKLKDRHEPSFGAGIRHGTSHPVVEVLHSAQAISSQRKLVCMVVLTLALQRKRPGTKSANHAPSRAS